MLFYITLNDAVIELTKALEKTKFYERFLDNIGIERNKYMQHVLLDYIWGSYINLYGFKCLKGKKVYNKQEMISRDYLPMGEKHKYKWKISCKKQRTKTSYEPVPDLDLDKEEAEMIAKILEENNPWEVMKKLELNLNSILSFNNDLLYTDISIKRIDLHFLTKNLESYLKGIFSKDDENKEKKKFSIVQFIKSILPKRK